MVQLEELLGYDEISLQELEDLQQQLHNLLLQRYGPATAAAVSPHKGAVVGHTHSTMVGWLPGAT